MEEMKCSLEVLGMSNCKEKVHSKACKKCSWYETAKEVEERKLRATKNAPRTF